MSIERQNIVLKICVMLLMISFAAVVVQNGTLNQRINGFRDELNACAESWTESRDWLDACQERLHLIEDKVQKAIEYSTTYCRG